MMKNIDILMEKLYEKLGDGYQVGCQTFKRNNGVERDGIFVTDLRNSDGKRYASPVIYLDSLYYLREEYFDLDKAVDEIIEVINACDKDFMTDYIRAMNRETVLKNVFPVLINLEKNYDLMHIIPCSRFLDLMVVYRVFLNDGQGSILVTSNLLDLFVIGEEELKSVAEINLINQSVKIKRLDDVIGEEIDDDIPKMIIFSNNSCVYGANILMKINTILDEDAVIIPSSIHEIIVMPGIERDDILISYIADMIMQVNTNEVEEHEILANRPYWYDSERGTVERL